MQYNLNKEQTICIFCSKWWQSRLNALSTSSPGFFFFSFFVLEVCILTILINQLELIETRIAISLYGSRSGSPAAAARSVTRLSCARVGVAAERSTRRGSGCGLLRGQADFSFLFLGWRVIKNREDSFCVPFLPTPTSSHLLHPGLSPTPPGGRAATRSPSPAPARGVSCAPQGARSVRRRVPLGPGALGSSPLSLRGVGTAVFRFEFFSLSLEAAPLSACAQW